MNVLQRTHVLPFSRGDIFNSVTLYAFRIDQGCMWVGGSRFYFWPAFSMSVCVFVLVEEKAKLSVVRSGFLHFLTKHPEEPWPDPVGKRRRK